jgi:hypothetical protein
VLVPLPLDPVLVMLPPLPPLPEDLDELPPQPAAIAPISAKSTIRAASEYISLLGEVLCMGDLGVLRLVPRNRIVLNRTFTENPFGGGSSYVFQCV